MAPYRRAVFSTSHHDTVRMLAYQHFLEVLGLLDDLLMARIAAAEATA